MALPPFRRVPYDASQATARMSDLVMRGGDIRAQGELQRGALWGGAVNQLGQIAGKTLGDLAAYREEAPKREAQQLALDKLRREESTEKNLAGLRQMAADGNLSSLDTAKLYEQAGYPEQALRIKEGYLKNLEIMGKVDAQKIDLAAHVATGVKKAGYTEAAFLNGLKRLEASGHFPPEELQPYRDAVEQLRKQIPAQALPRGIGVGPGADTPAPVQNAIKQFTDAVLERSPVDMTIRVLSEGAQMWQGGRMIAENPKAPTPTKALTPQERFNAAVAAGDEAGKAAALRDMGLVSGAQRDPRGPGGGEKPLTKIQVNAIETWRDNELEQARLEFERNTAPFRIDGISTPRSHEEKVVAAEQYDLRKRKIEALYYEKLGKQAPPPPPPLADLGRETVETDPTLSDPELLGAGYETPRAPLTRRRDISLSGPSVVPPVAQPGPAPMPPPVAAPPAGPFPRRRLKDGRVVEVLGTNPDGSLNVREIR